MSGFQSLQVRGLFSAGEIEEILSGLKQARAERWEEDTQVPGAYSRRLYFEGSDRLCTVVAQALGCAVVAVHGYARIYVAGNFLRPHMDTPDIPFGISVCLERGPLDWPLVVGDKRYIDEVGAGVVYDGSIKHYRLGRLLNEEQAQIFFHYKKVQNDRSDDT